MGDFDKEMLHSRHTPVNEHPPPKKEFSFGQFPLILVLVIDVGGKENERDKHPAQDKLYLSTLHDKKKRYIRIPENLYNNTLVCYLDPEGLVELGFTYNPIAGRETLSIIPLKFEDSLNPGVRKVASSICSSSSSSSSSSTSHAPAVRAERNWRADSAANCGQFILLAKLTDHRKQVGQFNGALCMSERCLLGGGSVQLVATEVPLSIACQPGSTISFQSIREYPVEHQEHGAYIAIPISVWLALI